MRFSSVLVPAFWSSIAAARPSDWHGIYNAVDPLDGGIITLSISGGAAGGDAVNLRFSDTMIRACTSLPQVLPDGWTGAGPDYSKRGLYLAEAVTSGNKLVTSEGAEKLPIQIYCFAGADDETVDGSPGVEIEASIEWSFARDDEDGGIIMDGSLFSGQNALLPNAEGTVTAGGDLTVRFHKESEPTGGALNGLYLGVDTLDGGIITLSVSDGDGAGAKNLRFSDTFIRACTSLPGGLPDGWEGAGPSDSRRGIYLVDAVADEGAAALVSAGGDAAVPVQIYCFAGPGDAALADGRPGVEFDAALAWTFDEADGGIIMSGSLFNGESKLVANDGTPAVGGDNAVRFHKTSDDPIDEGSTGKSKSSKKGKRGKR